MSAAPAPQRRRLVTAVVAVLVMSSVVPVDADEEIDNLRDEREALARDAAEVAAEINTLAADDEAVVEALADLDEYIAVQTTRIEAAEAAIAAAEADAARAVAAAEAVSAEIDEIRERLRDSAVDAFVVPDETQSSPLASRDLTENVVRQYLLDHVVGSEVDVVDQFREAAARRDLAREAALAAAAEAESRRIELDRRLAELEEARAAAEELRAEIQARMAAWEAISDEIAQADADIEAEIASLEEAQRRAEEEARRRAEEEARRKAEEEAAGEDPVDPIDPPAPGDFVLARWPTSGAVTSPFGERVHPIFGTVRPHRGIDINGSTGDPIGAASSGTVIAAGWRNGYGNTVVISHGGGYSTLYAHMSQTGVATGDTVEAGDIIGAVGSTGWSTGPHLHFELRISGVAVDPLPFLP